jgi:hypothetical protein
MDLNVRHAITPAYSAVPPFAFFVGGFEFSVEAACKMVVCIDVMGKRRVTIKSIASAKGRPGPLQGGTHASRVALCGPGPHAFFLLKHASVLYINSIYVIFSLLNTQVRVLLSESAHAYVVAHPIFPISITWQLCQPFVMWFLLSLSDHFSPIGNQNRGQQFKTS